MSSHHTSQTVPTQHRRLIVFREGVRQLLFLDSCFKNGSVQAIVRILVKLQSMVDELVRGMIEAQRLYACQDATRSKSDGLGCRSFVGKVAVTLMTVSNLQKP